VIVAWLVWRAQKAVSRPRSSAVNPKNSNPERTCELWRTIATALRACSGNDRSSSTVSPGRKSPCTRRAQSSFTDIQRDAAGGLNSSRYQVAEFDGNAEQCSRIPSRTDCSPTSWVAQCGRHCNPPKGGGARTLALDLVCGDRRVQRLFIDSPSGLQLASGRAGYWLSAIPSEALRKMASKVPQMAVVTVHSARWAWPGFGHVLQGGTGTLSLCGDRGWSRIRHSARRHALDNPYALNRIFPSRESSLEKQSRPILQNVPAGRAETRYFILLLCSHPVRSRRAGSERSMEVHVKTTIDP